MKRNDLLTLFMPALNGGGAERVMLGLAKEFVRRGYSVDLESMVPMAGISFLGRRDQRLSSEVP